MIWSLYSDKTDEDQLLFPSTINLCILQSMVSFEILIFNLIFFSHGTDMFGEDKNLLAHFPSACLLVRLEINFELVYVFIAYVGSFLIVDLVWYIPKFSWVAVFITTNLQPFVLN